MAELEQLVLDGIALNTSAGDYQLEEVSFPPPKKRAEWAQSGDADGAALVRDPLFENREVTAKVRVTNQASMDLALAKIGTLVDKLEEAERQENGIALVWTPAESTKSVTFYVLSGEVEDVPVAVGGDSGWFVRQPVVTLRMVCKPFGYGAEVTVAPSTTSTAPLLTLTAAGVTGDVPAEGRLIVTDGATRNRRHLEWGAQQVTYDAATALLIDSDDMTAISGTGTTRTGAYDPNATGNSVIRGTLTTEANAVCHTGDRTHVGAYRVKGRVYLAGAGGEAGDKVFVRFTWRQGEGPYRTNTASNVPVSANWAEVDLGTISLAQARVGTQTWRGQVEVYTTSTTTGMTLDVDYLELIPTEVGYGKGRAVGQAVAGATVGSDEFTGTAAGGALNARVAPTGGTWATSGSTTDFTFADASLPTAGEQVTRATVSDTGAGRFAVLGATNYTDQSVTTQVYFTAAVSGVRQGVVLRYVDANNYLVAVIDHTATAGTATASIISVVAGSATTLSTGSATNINANSWVPISATVLQDGGTVTATFGSGADDGGALTAQSTALAGGGALATGKPGFIDRNTSATASTRYYDNFYVTTPAAEPLVIASGRTAEIRHDSAIRQNSTGVYYGDLPYYRGSRFLLPPAGAANRTSRVAVKARRNDVDISADDQIADSITVQVRYTPRYYAVPR